jgi:hypothetical protein
VIQALLNPSVVDPPLDGVTPVFGCVGADPTLAPGVNWPPGSLCYYSGNWYWKYGTGLTDWTINPFTTGSGGGASVASWSVGTANRRFFAINPAAPDDSAAGYSDVSAAAAWLVAKKTFAGFAAIFPQLGAGRSALVLNGAATMGEDLLLTRWTGYDTVHFVGTTDGSDSSTDRMRSGFVTAAAGPNGDGSWTCVAGGSTTDIKVAGGLPSETSTSGATLWRVRFATGALAGTCTGIYANTATDITPTSVLGGAPAAGDTFFVERSGVIYGTVTVNGIAKIIVIRGIAAAATTGTPFGVSGCQGSSVRLVGCESRDGTAATSVSGVAFFSAGTSYSHLVSGSATVGFGFRSGGQWGISSCGSLSGDSSGSTVGQAHPTFLSSIQRIPSVGFGGGCVFYGPVLAVQLGGPAAPRPLDPRVTSVLSNLGAQNTAQFQPLRIFGDTGGVGLDIEACTLLVQNANITTTYINGSGVRVSGDGSRIVFSNVAGAQPGGGAAYGFELDTAHSGEFVFLSCTASGPSGDIRAAGAWIAYTDLTKTNVVDILGNDISGTGNHLVSQCGYSICEDAAGVEPGMALYISSAGKVTRATRDSLAEAACVAVAVNTAALNGGVYWTTGGMPYVKNSGTLTAGGEAFVGPSGTLTSDAPASGKYQLRAGRWIDGSAGVSGYVVFNPEHVPVLVP